MIEERKAHIVRTREVVNNLKFVLLVKMIRGEDSVINTKYLSKAFVGILFFLVIVQGGFFERSFLTASLILTVIFLITFIGSKGIIHIIIKTAGRKEICCFTGMVFIFILSAVYHQTSFKDCGRIGYMYLVLIIYIYLLFLNNFNKLYNSVILAGVLESGITLLAYAGINLPSVIVNARNMGSFQYANATALFMGIVLVLQWGISKEKDILYKERIIMLVTLMLTFSIGGIVLYIFFITISEIVTRWGNKEILYTGLLKIFCETAISIAFAILIYYFKFRMKNNTLVWLCIMLVVVVSTIVKKIYYIIEKINIKISICSLLVVVISEIYIGILFFGERALGTATERIQQMSDALCVIYKKPLLGLGMHEWKKYIETQPRIAYKVSLVHNSYLQLGIEAGIFAMLNIFFIIFIWYYKIFCKKVNIKIWQVCIMTMALVHFSIDITFFFGGIIIVLMVCIFPDKQTELK